MSSHQAQESESVAEGEISINDGDSCSQVETARPSTQRSRLNKCKLKNSRVTAAATAFEHS